MFLFGFETHHGYYRELIRHVVSIPSKHVVLTGHSLGGGIAHIAGAITKHRSITFSPPGDVFGCALRFILPLVVLLSSLS